jgi:cytoskeletal protein CcmA (bactofilin family)
MSDPYDLGKKKHTSVLGPTLSFKGELKAEEDLLIRGRVEGSIEHTSNLTIGEDGKVKADIKAAFIAVEGKVEGDLKGTKSVVIKDTADIKGNIYSPTVSLHEGSTFNGKIDMSGKEPATKQLPKVMDEIGDAKAKDEVVAQADTKKSSKPKKQASNAA